MAKRRRYGAVKTNTCSLGGNTGAAMRWLARNRTGGLDKDLLHSARVAARATPGKPEKAVKKLTKKIKRSFSKMKLQCFFKKGMTPRACLELQAITRVKPNFESMARCYLSRVNFALPRK